jgi:hypothetical protein
MQIEDQKLFDIPVSCQRLGNWSPWTMRKHIAAGNVPVIRIGKRIFLSEETIDRIAREGLPPLRANADKPAAPERSLESRSR